MNEKKNGVRYWEPRTNEINSRIKETTLRNSAELQKQLCTRTFPATRWQKFQTSLKKKKKSPRNYPGRKGSFITGTRAEWDGEQAELSMWFWMSKRSELMLPGWCCSIHLVLFLTFSLNPALRSLPQCCPSVSLVAAVYQWHPSFGVLQVDSLLLPGPDTRSALFPIHPKTALLGGNVFRLHIEEWGAGSRALSRTVVPFAPAALRRCCSRADSHEHSHTWYHPACYLAWPMGSTVFCLFVF